MWVPGKATSIKSAYVSFRAREIVGFAGSGPILSLKTDFVLNRKQKNRSIKVRFFPVQFLITVYNSYLSRQFTVNFTPYNTLSCLIRLYTHVLQDLGVSSADQTDYRMKRVGPLYTACRVEG